jgi:hypothetical protein
MYTSQVITKVQSKKNHQPFLILTPSFDFGTCPLIINNDLERINFADI